MEIDQNIISFKPDNEQLSNSWNKYWNNEKREERQSCPYNNNNNNNNKDFILRG